MDSTLPSSSRRMYRSKKQRPCDACRRRKICCVREANSPACSLCALRSTTCTYYSQPNIRRRRPVQPQEESHATTSSPASAESAEEWTPLFVGFSSDQDPYILRHCQFTGDSFNRPDWRCRRMALSTETGKVAEIPMHFAVVPDSHLDTTEQGLPHCPHLNLPFDLYDGLMRTFFEVVHTSLPLLDGGRFENKTGNKSPLVAVMCRLARHFSPEIRGGALIDNSWPEWRAYLHQAVAIQARSPRLETIEMGLLFMQRPLSTHRAPNLPGLWPLIGSLVGMAHDLGLNVDPTGWAIEDSERKRRIRIWWALYMADKWNALGSGRPSYIHEDNWDVPMVTVNDMPTGYRGGVLLEATGRMFVAMAHLTTILSDALGRLYSIRAIHSNGKDPEGVFEESDNFMARLEKFQNDHINALEWPEEHVRNPTGTLTLALYTVHIILCRAVIRRVHADHPRLAQLRIDSRRVSSAMIHFVERLQVTHLRAFWWSPMSRTNFAIAGSFMVTMLLSSTDNEDIEFWTAQIQRYRVLLEMHAATFDITKLAVNRMNLIASVIDKGTEHGLDEIAEAPDLANLSSLFGDGTDAFVDVPADMFL